MTPGARGGTRCRPHFARRYPHFLQHSGWFRRSSGRHKWRPYVFCAGRLWVAATFRAFSVAVVDRRTVGSPFMTPGAVRAHVGRRMARGAVGRNGTLTGKNSRGDRFPCQPFRITCQPTRKSCRPASGGAPVIRASQVAPLRFLCRRLWVAASLRAFSVAVVDCRIVGAPFMTPGAREGTRCRSHFARRHPHFLQHSGWLRRSSGRHKWSPYVFCAGRRFFLSLRWSCASGGMKKRGGSRRGVWPWEPPRVGVADDGVSQCVSRSR